MERRRLLTRIAAGALPLLAGCNGAVPGDRSERTVTQTVGVTDDRPLVVTNRNGPVTVEGSDREDVDVTATFSSSSTDALESASIETETGDQLRVTTTVDEGSPSDVSTELRIECPSDLRVESVESTNGSLDVSGVGGFVSLATSNASITARDLQGLGDVTTENGSVDVEVPAVRADTLVETTNAGIDAAIAADLDVQVEAQTTNGSIDHGGLDFRDTDASDAQFSGRLGDGTTTLQVQTTNSSVDLRPL